jgi:hypothetical protein
MSELQAVAAELTSQWSVWRIDDNGNVFLCRAGLNESAARQLAAEFEARGHKQMYWVAEGENDRPRVE